MSRLCPSLGTTLSADQLSEMSKLLEMEAKNSFSTWVGDQMAAFASSLAQVTSGAPLTVLPAWDKVTIEETGDSGQQVMFCNMSPSLCYVPLPNISTPESRWPVSS